MTSAQIDSLHTGDEVFWNDPDNGACSRVYVIDFIEWLDQEEGAVRIIDRDGDFLECYITELE